MTESFEKFLKEQKIIPKKDEKFMRILLLTNADREGFIPVKDLGEWAWKNAIPFIKEHFENTPTELIFEDFIQPNELDEFGIDYLSIAVACLGKKEIEKRLKELIE